MPTTTIEHGRRRRGLATGVAALLLLAGCGDPGPSASGTGPVRVVTATDVYADIVRQIGGDAVDVRPLISSNSGADPHSYEASARDQLAVRKAALVVTNGGGYDEFLTRALDAAGGHRAVLTAFQGPGDNEHVWYDLKAMNALATAISATLTALRPTDRAEFATRTTTFRTGLADLMHRQTTIRTAHHGAAVAITEPVPLFLVADCGLVNQTPPEFSQAIEEGSDVPVRVLQDTLKLFSDHVVDVLVYNSQTTGPQTERVEHAAEDAKIPVVPMSETLPAGQNYLSWMRANLDALEAALR
jgi:zinc/manganese transport system substrate-binding protein